MMIIITSKIFKKIDDNSYIKNIQRDRWEYLDQKYSKGSVGIPRSKAFKENTTKLNLNNIVSSKKKSSSENDDWPFRMLIIGPSGSGKTNTLLHLIDKFHPIDRIYFLCQR